MVYCKTLSLPYTAAPHIPLPSSSKRRILRSGPVSPLLASSLFGEGGGVPWPSLFELQCLVLQAPAWNRSPFGAGGSGATRSRWPGEFPTASRTLTKSPQPCRLQPTHNGQPPGIPDDENPLSLMVWEHRKGQRWSKKGRKIK